MLNLFVVLLIIVVNTIINNILLMNNNLMDSVLKVSANVFPSNQLVQG